MPAEQELNPSPHTVHSHVASRENDSIRKSHDARREDDNATRNSHDASYERNEPGIEHLNLSTPVLAAMQNAAAAVLLVLHLAVIVALATAAAARLQEKVRSHAKHIAQHMEHIIFGGGGPKGFAHVGAMRQLLHTARIPYAQVRARIQSVTGVSAGAIAALAVAAGVHPDRMAQLITRADYLNSPASASHGTMALLSHACISKLVDDICNAAGLAKDVTLATLRARTGVNLRIYASNVTQQRLELFDAGNSVPVRWAVAASASAPPVFGVVWHPATGDAYLDGGLIWNTPTVQDPYFARRAGGTVCFGFAASTDRTAALQHMLQEQEFLEPLWPDHAAHTALTERKLSLGRASRSLVTRASSYLHIVLGTVLAGQEALADRVARKAECLCDARMHIACSMLDLVQGISQRLRRDIMRQGREAMQQLLEAAVSL